jgi:hypothetical protein
MRRHAVLLLALPIFASCSLVAGLGDFEPADEGSGAAGAGSPASGTGASGAQGGGGASSQGGAGSSQGGGGNAPGPGGGPNGGAGPGGNGAGGAPECDAPPCDVGAPCVNPSDCKTGVCEDSFCACNDHLLISELRSRGPGGNPGNNDFIELYNPTGNFITLAAGEWTVEYRSATGSTWTPRWASTGEILAPYGHLLLANSGFNGAGVTANHTYLQGIGDDAAVRLKHVATIIDTVCYCMIGPCEPYAGYGCEGTPVVNPAQDSSISMERKGGGMSGSCIDTNDNAADFKETAPSDPQNLASPTVP